MNNKGEVEKLIKQIEKLQEDIKNTAHWFVTLEDPKITKKKKDFKTEVKKILDDE